MADRQLASEILEGMKMFTTVATKRREFISPFLSGDNEILEVGPFNNPTFRKDVGEKVWTMDMFSKEELIHMHKGNPNRQADSISETDFVVKDLCFSKSIPRKFDMICAHHVIEHLSDFILWFNECESLLHDCGKVFISVPDRRYTFDFFRPVSLASQMVRSHEECAQKPQLWQVVEHFYYHQKVNLTEIWDGEPPLSFAPRFTLAEAISRAKVREAMYTDTHCWVFTPDSFVRVIEDLRSSHYLRFSIEALQDTQKGSNEFRAVLSKD